MIWLTNHTSSDLKVKNQHEFCNDFSSVHQKAPTYRTLHIKDVNWISEADSENCAFINTRWTFKTQCRCLTFDHTRVCYLHPGWTEGDGGHPAGMNKERVKSQRHSVINPCALQLVIVNKDLQAVQHIRSAVTFSACLGFSRCSGSLLVSGLRLRIAS